MIREQLICFDLGYQVEDLTDFRDRLVDMFGIGGSVKHARNGDILEFDVLMEYGTLRLDSSRKVLELNMDSSDYGTIISSEDIQTLYKKSALYNFLKILYKKHTISSFYCIV